MHLFLSSSYLDIQVHTDIFLFFMLFSMGRLRYKPLQSHQPSSSMPTTSWRLIFSMFSQVARLCSVCKSFLARTVQFTPSWRVNSLPSSRQTTSQPPTLPLRRLVTSMVSFANPSLCKSLFQSDACNARALRNEGMILEVLEAEEPAVFRQELFNTLEHCYEVILGLPNAG